MNRLVEKSDNANPKIEKKEESKTILNREKRWTTIKRQYEKVREPIKEDNDKEEKNETIERLKEYDWNKKMISAKGPKGKWKIFNNYIWEKSCKRWWWWWRRSLKRYKK